MSFDSEKQTNEIEKSTFDIVKVGDFHNYGCGTIMSYIWVWTLIALKVAILASDTYTCVCILAFKGWGTENYQVYEYKIAKWIFTGCIGFRFLLLLWQLSWAVHIYRRGNIALAYLNNYARLMYAIRYKYQCVFHEIELGGTLPWATFFVYYELDNALEVLVADAPRTVINVMTLKNYAVGSSDSNVLENIRDIAVNNMKLSIILSVMLCSVVIFLFFFFKFCLGILCYIPVKVKASHSGFKTIKAFCYFHVNDRVRMLVSRHHKSKAQLLLDGILDIQEINANPLLQSNSDADLPGKEEVFTHPAYMKMSSFDKSSIKYSELDVDTDYSRPPRAHTASSLRNNSYGSESTRLPYLNQDSNASQDDPFAEKNPFTRSATSDTFITDLTFNPYSDARAFDIGGDSTYRGYTPLERPNPLELASFLKKSLPDTLMEETGSYRSQDDMLDERDDNYNEAYLPPPYQSPLLGQDRSESPFDDSSEVPYPVRGVSKYFERK